MWGYHHEAGSGSLTDLPVLSNTSNYIQSTVTTRVCQYKCALVNRVTRQDLTRKADRLYDQLDLTLVSVSFLFR